MQGLRHEGKLQHPIRWWKYSHDSRLALLGTGELGLWLQVGILSLSGDSIMPPILALLHDSFTVLQAAHKALGKISLLHIMPDRHTFHIAASYASSVCQMELISQAPSSFGEAWWELAMMLLLNPSKQWSVTSLFLLLGSFAGVPIHSVGGVKAAAVSNSVEHAVGHSEPAGHIAAGPR